MQVFHEVTRCGEQVRQIWHNLQQRQVFVVLDLNPEGEEVIASRPHLLRLEVLVAAVVQLATALREVLKHLWTPETDARAEVLQREPYLSLELDKERVQLEPERGEFLQHGKAGHVLAGSRKRAAHGEHLEEGRDAVDVLREQLTAQDMHGAQR